MNEENEISPDEILKAVQKEEAQKGLGRLKIFFGMSAGVGKTFAMLEDAHRRQKEGVNVVVGVINTHGRKETEALVQGLTIIPEKWVQYKDAAFEEFDIDTVLQLKPELVLVDELAHTNVPGSRHPKRWQDVVELLDAGIDVYTTLNVQHIESRKEVVEGLTGIQIRETVPDLILERATTVEIVDISPTDLLKRLHEGKVYLGEQSVLAAQHFFKEENLTALRELALRFAAEKAEHDLHGMLVGKGWRTRERVMVAISPSPSSEPLIRAARRLAFELDAPWIAVYVDTGALLNDKEQAKLFRHFNLARELGAEILTTHDLDIATGLQRIAKQKDITRIVVGRDPKPKRTFWNFFKPSFIERLERENKDIDLVILRRHTIADIYQRAIPTQQPGSRLKPYLISCGCVLVLAAIGFAVTPFIGYKAVGFIFLMGILLLSLFLGPGPTLLAAALSALIWDFIPDYSIFIHDPEDLALIIIYFCVASIMGVLNSRLRKQDQFLHMREEKLGHLYEIDKDIAKSTNLQTLRLNVGSRLEALFPGKFDILIKNTDNRLVLDSRLALLKDEKEKAAALWTFQHGKLSGRSTDTLPSTEGIYFPIQFSKSTVGVLVYSDKRKRPLSLEQINFIQTVAQQLGIYLERYVFEERVSGQDYTRQIERLYNAIFHSFNVGFYTPLNKMAEINQELLKSHLDTNSKSFLAKMENLIGHIKFTVDNIIGISELESGFIHFEHIPHTIKELLDACLQDIKQFSYGHPVFYTPSVEIILPCDSKLLKLALSNLILNAIENSPPGRPVLIDAKKTENQVELSVIDEGPGIPQDQIPLIFEKFYRIRGAPAKGVGLGLGLTIVKTIIDLHEGKIEVKSEKAGGTVFTLIFPV